MLETVEERGIKMLHKSDGKPGNPSQHMKIMLEGVHLYYGAYHALKGITLAIPERGITALIGPSGCGKSTCLKTINRMNDLIEGCKITGKVTIDEEDIYNPRTDVTLLRKRAGMVFQKPNPFPLSVYENVAYGPKVHGIRRRAQLEELVERSLRDAALWEEVKDRLKKPALGLSGGQQQRLCIARALAVQPDILLMDEPTSALDPVSTAQIEQLMGRLRQAYTVVIVTHNMQQAARIAGQTAFFLAGEVVEWADTRTLFGSPKDERTQRYLSGRFG